ncbi:GtrA family protein [Roseobacter sp. YSTF-M11]|uniref:GtrA family protein n=1 Tax=Roseobacter insulae TaxID=2859783 RepID=A0A9X1K0R9_9RHOB|nr:GtrA family protein [Roseobacter insulae]MBW4710821.1 GtrA family protein [Roseobacter insulae]
MARQVSAWPQWQTPDVATQRKLNLLARQLFSYAFVGIASNLAGYLAYLLITGLWLPPKLAMSILYAVGATVGYFGNKKLTFSHSADVMGSALRYVIAHLIGYGINLTLLIIFVDQLGYPHQWVQAIAIFCVAGYLFVAFKFFVFPSRQSAPRGKSNQ